MTTRPRPAIAATFCLAVLVAIDADAYMGARTVLPAPTLNAPSPFSAKTGLRVEVDNRWFNSAGYLPVRVRVFARAASLSPRRVRVEVMMLSSSRALQSGGDSGAITVGQEMVLPAGETAAEAIVPCPQASGWDRFGQAVQVDGVFDPGLSYRPAAAVSVGQAWPRSGPEALGVLRPIDGDTSDRRRLNDATFGRSPRSWMVMSNLASESFDDWIIYAGVDAIRLKINELRELAQKRPERLTAIRRWLIAGGTVWVEQAEPTGSGSERMEEGSLSEIDDLLRIERMRFRANESEKNPPLVAARDEEDAGKGETAGEGDEEEDSRRGETFVPCEDAPSWSYLKPPDRDYADLAEAGEALIAELLRQRSSVEGRDSRPWYALREAGFGRVIAFRGAATPVPRGLAPGVGQATQRSWRERDWSHRHGIEPGGMSLSFGNLLIPSVGVAPVTEFQVLITLFVLAIGPLNYWLLWRRQQLQLLVVTAPLGALAVTLGLFAYAAVADGFGVKARVRSVTVLDQAQGEAASWSRVTHYVATPPSEPATFDRDTAIYAINPAWESAIGSTVRNRTVEWSEGEQRLVGGWTPTRTSVQHLLVRSRSTSARIAIQEDGANLKASNQLGAEIELLVVRDADGRWRRAASIREGEDATLEIADRAELVREYRLLAVENEPRFPIGAGKAIEQTLQRLGQARNVRRKQRNFSGVTLDDNLQNRLLDQVSGLAGGDPLDLPPRTYLAVTRTAVETPLGWEDVEEIGSFHVTLGRW